MRSAGPDHAELFAQLVADAAPEVVAASIQALGRLGHPAALERILEALTNPHGEVRAEAAEAAARLGLPAAIEPLIALLDDPAWTARYAAGRALRALGPQGEAALQAVAAHDASREQRTAALILAEGLAA